MKGLYVLLLCVLLAASPARGASLDWTEYSNERFGYSARYPSLWGWRQEPIDDAGVYLKSRSGHYRLELRGGACVPAELPDGVKDAPLCHRSVRQSDRETLHEYLVVHGGRWASFVFVFPREKNPTGLIRRLERDLRVLGK